MVIRPFPAPVSVDARPSGGEPDAPDLIFLDGLNWPAPHQMRLIDPGSARAEEPAVVTLAEGETEQHGTVLHIDFDEGFLDFTSDARQTTRLPFTAVRIIRLTRPVGLEPLPSVLSPGDSDVREVPEGLETPPAHKRPVYSVAFRDASTLETEVVAVLPSRAGLFLFVPDPDGSVLRWFVPAVMMINFRELETEAAAAQRHAHPVTVVHVGAVTREELELALQGRSKLTYRRLGELLVAQGHVTRAQCDEALAQQRRGRHRALGELLVAMGATTHEVVGTILVQQLGMPSVNLTRFQCDPNAIKAMSGGLARKHVAMPLYRTATHLVMAVETPLSWSALHELEFFSGLKIDQVIAPRTEILLAISQYFDDPLAGEKLSALVEDLSRQEHAAEPHLEEPVTESDNTLVRLVNKMIMDACDQGASDIHIETRPGNKPSRVRFRVDGELAPYVDVPANFRAALVSRLKIMSGLNISEKRRPQDGKINFESQGRRRVELRVVVMPTSAGLEDVVLRILAAPRALALDQLSLAPRDLDAVKAMAERSFGLMFVSGPTGSGKTTTLHSVLNHINKPNRKIWTVEDPIEITQDGLCQVQVNNKLGLSFPEVLRSFLRADPDVIMVGETRDSETARTVIAASLTGHLVLSTMHTNSAVESVVRLLDFGLDPFNFADALLGVVGQRLVRKLCTHCCTVQEATTAQIENLAHEYCRDTASEPAAVVSRWRARYGSTAGVLKLHAPVGCPTCDGTGYKGRMGVYEVLVATPALKARIVGNAGSSAILEEAVKGGMLTMVQDGIEKILQGHTDLKQVLASCR